MYFTRKKGTCGLIDKRLLILITLTDKPYKSNQAHQVLLTRKENKKKMFFIFEVYNFGQKKLSVIWKPSNNGKLIDEIEKQLIIIFKQTNKQIIPVVLVTVGQWEVFH